jgi:hypothetical protein
VGGGEEILTVRPENNQSKLQRKVSIKKNNFWESFLASVRKNIIKVPEKNERKETTKIVTGEM